MAQFAGLLSSAGGASAAGGGASALGGGASAGGGSSMLGGLASGAMGSMGGGGGASGGGGKAGSDAKKGGLMGEVPAGQDIMTNLANVGREPNHVVNLLSTSGNAGMGMPAIPKTTGDGNGSPSLIDQMLEKLGQNNSNTLSNADMAAKARAEAGH